MSLYVSLMKDSTQIALLFFFPGLTYTNVLMDRGDKENEGEEGRTVRPTHTHPHTHTHTQKILWGGRFAGMQPTSDGREGAEGDI